MKNNILLLLLLFIIFNLSAQSHQENIQKWGKDSVCINAFQKHHAHINSILDGEQFEYYSTKINPNLRFKDYVDCLVFLANHGNREAHDSIIAMNDFLFRKSLMVQNFSLHQEIKSMLRNSLAKISSPEAFEIGLKFFSQNICISDLIGKDKMYDYPDTNYGIIAFELVLLPMIHEEQKKSYHQYYINTLRTYGKTRSSNDDGMKKFHDIWYPIVKKDWEEGKIKLRHEK